MTDYIPVVAQFSRFDGIDNISVCPVLFNTSSFVILSVHLILNIPLYSHILLSSTHTYTRYVYTWWIQDFQSGGYGGKGVEKRAPMHYAIRHRVFTVHAA